MINRVNRVQYIEWRTVRPLTQWFRLSKFGHKTKLNSNRLERNLVCMMISVFINIVGRKCVERIGKVKRDGAHLAVLV